MGARKSFLLRTSPETLEALRRWAAQEMRSVNGQLEFVLRQALHRQGLLRRDPEPTPRADEDRAGDVRAEGDVETPDETRGNA